MVRPARRHRRLDLPLDAYDTGPLLRVEDEAMPDPAFEPIAFLRAAIRAGTDIQALALTTESSKATFANFRQGVRAALDERDGAFGDYRTKESGPKDA